MLTDNAIKRIRTQEPYLENLLNNYRMSEDINESLLHLMNLVNCNM